MRIIVLSVCLMHIIQLLFESKRFDENHCPFCMFDARHDLVDSISTCRHIFCELCCYSIYPSRECPTCHGIIDVLSAGLWCINSKSTWVINHIQQHIEQNPGSLAKILVLSSSKENLCLLNRALICLSVESSMCLCVYVSRV
jgi:hypothetical protein